MGFEVPDTVFPLYFEDPQFQGIEVMMRRPSVAGMGDTMRLSNINYKALIAEDVELINRIFGYFTESLVSWNLEKKGIPVSPTQEGIESLEDVFVLIIILVWVKTLTGQGVDPSTIPMTNPS